jgi:hypothetical protein
MFKKNICPSIVRDKIKTVSMIPTLSFASGRQGIGVFLSFCLNNVVVNINGQQPVFVPAVSLASSHDRAIGQKSCLDGFVMHLLYDSLYHCAELKQDNFLS